MIHKRKIQKRKAGTTKITKKKNIEEGRYLAI
jgi:hypothetical protein